MSNFTRIINDYGWNYAYSLQLNHFKKDDVLIVASVHGGVEKDGKIWSGNLVEACEVAKKKGGTVLALLGGDGGLIKGLADVSIIVPHEEAGVVEGIHGVLAHMICSRLKEMK